MPRLEISDERIKAIVLIKLRNRGCWGARYYSAGQPHALAQQKDEERWKKSSKSAKTAL